MLENSFYYIQSLEQEDGVVKADFTLDAAHPIFHGHFPDQPVVPGACMLQIEKELLEKAVGSTVQLTKAINIKYIAHITPDMACAMRIQYALKEDGIDVTGVITANGQACYKSKCQYSH